MNKAIIATVALLAASIGEALAGEIDSKVIHHYTYLSAGYGYLHDVADVANAHGVVSAVSFEEHNFVLGISGSHFWTEEDIGADDTLWGAGGSFGYVFRLAGNHLNIVPRFGAGYGHVLPDVRTLSISETEDWSLFPSISASYALNNRIAFGGTYGFAYNLQTEDETHVFGAAAQIAIRERVGVNIGASFAEEIGFTGLTAALELHF